MIGEHISGGHPLRDVPHLGGKPVEAQTDIQTYLEQGKQALAQGQGREAAIAYAHGAQLEPDNPMVHLGLAEANLALGNYGVVQMACRRVQELQPAGGIEASTAQALLDLLERRYERALRNVDAVISEDPSIAYVHALRAYLLRQLNQDYDANLARARSARLAYGGRFNEIFPPVSPEPAYTTGYSGPPAAAPAPEQSSSPRVEREAVPTWSRPNQLQRQAIRTRFALSRYPALVTQSLIVINVVIYVLSQLFPILYAVGIQDNTLVVQGEYWRIFTAMFLHEPIIGGSLFNIAHLAFNMLSLFFIGPTVEIIYGKWRYLLIYVLAGIGGGLLYLFTQPGGQALGASGAIFDIFGALGTFYLMNRRAIGGGALSNWLFWVGLNLVWGFSNPQIGVVDHIGGLVIGMLLAYLLMPRPGTRRF